jgi:hypothetical protein
MGRVEHYLIADQSGADPRRVEQVIHVMLSIGIGGQSSYGPDGALPDS